jgi:hypothetical protein
MVSHVNNNCLGLGQQQRVIRGVRVLVTDLLSCSELCVVITGFFKCVSTRRFIAASFPLATIGIDYVERTEARKEARRTDNKTWVCRST